MNILIVNNSIIPVKQYGGTERVIWYLGKELASLGHKVYFLVKKGSYCPFATVLPIDESLAISKQIPDYIDIAHFQFPVTEPISKPYVITFHGNHGDKYQFDFNTIFVSRNHANRYGSDSFVYNGLDWSDYEKPNLLNARSYFHFLGDAAWKVKNVAGAIDVIKKTKNERLQVLGGHRLNFRMGFRFTTSTRVSFSGFVTGRKKINLLQGSKGLIFPVRWHEPFGLAITESLYMGCPVFGTTYGSLRELVPDRAGFLANDSNKLATAIDNVEDYDRQWCHEYARDLFNSRVMAEAYLEKYHQVLQGSSLNKVKPQLITLPAEKYLPWK